MLRLRVRCYGFSAKLSILFYTFEHAHTASECVPTLASQTPFKCIYIYIAMVLERFFQLYCMFVYLCELCCDVL